MFRFAFSFGIVGFVAVLSHEMGHAYINRRHHEESSIVLYSFGGLTFRPAVIRERRSVERVTQSV